MYDLMNLYIKIVKYLYVKFKMRKFITFA